ncbi:hypothetical protein SDC9_130104 [bioreactor metagenome]|uniref:Uncharacterized protein n=1 Tax=bioreactor metagenome TaxID=1076179 RepID=A0A645D1L2_9ZZZZ
MGCLDNGRVGMLLFRGKVGCDHQRQAGGGIGMENCGGVDAVNPHHGCCGVANHRARSTRIRGCDNGSQKTDMEFSLKELVSHGATDQGRGDVVEEA